MREHENGNRLDSLSFLRKPQRIKQWNAHPCHDEDATNLSPTVYKKSGELLKSSLKKRSKSLPSSSSSSLDGYYADESTPNFNALASAGRSKSVHFDATTPIRFFTKDQSPIDISQTTEVSDALSFVAKPLHTVVPHNSPDGVDIHPTCDEAVTHKVRGLYNINFPTLSNKNPKILKLNIFVSLSQRKPVFLQDMSLSIIQDQVLTHSFIQGRIMVQNIFYNKRVVLKYTWNHWATFDTVECVYISDARGILPSANMDIFKFVIDHFSTDNGHLEFCVHFVTRNEDGTDRREYWDNNNGKNYKVDIVTGGFNNPFI